MKTTILVPLDGSALSECALPYAEAISRQNGARIVLTRVALAHRPLGGDRASDEARAIEEIEAYLARVAERLGKHGQAVECAVPYGDAASSILAEIRIQRADLVVMATHGRGGLGRLLFGSVADQVLRGSSVPVLLVPASCERSLADDQEPRMMVTLDGSAFGEQILGPASQVATTLGARLLLLGVAPKLPISRQNHGARAALLRIDTGEPPPTHDKIEGYLERIADELRGKGHAVEVYATTGDVARNIVAEAHTQRASLIAMATHGRSGLARLVLGSVATATLRQAGLPMLLVRPTGLLEELPADELAAVR